MKKVKIGYIGLGRRGMSVLTTCFSQMPDVEVAVLCDLHEHFLDKGQEVLKENGGYEAKLTTNADEIFADPTIDAVIIMTGWNDRIDLVIKSMRAGKYTGFEVGCAINLDECYTLLEAYKETKMPAMMLENCCYGRREMMALNLAEQGLFGEIVHCEGGYHHYLTEWELLSEEHDEELLKKANLWPKVHHYRIDNYVERNCENYPTHELGPISKVLKLNRGNRMLTLNSVSSKAVAINAIAKKCFGEDNKYAKIQCAQGDIVTTIITCANGETIKLCLDTTLPRAFYSRNFTVRGTDAMQSEERKVLYFEGMEEVENNEEEMVEKYDHPLHKEYKEEVANDAHGGMDWLVCRAFVESVKAGTNTPIDIYDSLLWLAIGPLSEQSIKLGGAPVEVPDFTEGKWKNREPIVEGKYCLDKVCVDKSIKIYPKGE